MNLTIRSQDKKGLFKVDNIDINDYNGYYYVVSIINNREVKLGKYGFHTSTRALEILDEIQKRINLINMLTVGIHLLDIVKEEWLEEAARTLMEQTTVYEMPKE